MSALSFVTFNVWFNYLHRDQRTKALCSYLGKLSPTFVCLQEVIPDTARSFIPYLQRLGYACSFANPDSFNTHLKGMGTGYGVLLFSQLKLHDIRLARFQQTGMGRYYINAGVRDHAFRVICTHLESLPANAVTRQGQLQEIMRDLGTEQPFVWGMDSNLLSHEDDSLIAPYDAFIKAKSPDDRKITFDGSKNKTILNPRHVSRLDRVLFRLPGYKLQEFDLLGQNPIPSIGVPPSDHYGVWISLAASTR